MRLVCKLRWYGFTYQQVNTIMENAKIGKWRGSVPNYAYSTWMSAMSIAISASYSLPCCSENFVQNGEDDYAHKEECTKANPETFGARPKHKTND